MTEIAIVSPYPPKGESYVATGAVSSYTAHLAQALTARGLAVRVVAPRLDGDPAEFDDGAVHVHRCYPLGVRALPAALAAARETDPDLVHVQWDPTSFGSRLSELGLVPSLVTQRTWRALVRRRDPDRLRPVVATMHRVAVRAQVPRTPPGVRYADVAPVPARAASWALQEGLRRSADAVIVHEPSFGELVRGAHVIPHGVDAITSTERDALRRELRLDGRFVVICFGVIAEYTGLVAALEAAALAGPRVHLVVIGAEHRRARGSGYLEHLRHWFGRTATFTGPVFGGDAAAWCAAADLALFPHARPLGSSDTLALAMGHGTPLLVSPAIGRSIGAPAALTVPIDADVLGRRLEQLAGPDPAPLDELRRYSEAYSQARRWDLVAARHHQLYEQLCRAADADRSESLRRAG